MAGSGERSRSMTEPDMQTDDASLLVDLIDAASAARNKLAVAHLALLQIAETGPDPTSAINNIELVFAEGLRELAKAIELADRPARALERLAA
jgi:hypothetical protein